MSVNLKSICQRVSKAGSVWALADQVVVSIGNFGSTLLIARGLPPAEYGTFVLISAACLVAFGIHTNLMVSPLVVRSATADAAKTRTYSGSALLLTLVVLPLSALVVVPAASSLERQTAGLLALVYVLAWQLQETTRRTLSSKLRYREAIWGDAISYVGQAVLIGLLIRKGWATLDRAFAVMAATSLIAAAMQGWQARVKRVTWAEFLETGIEFWNLAKWLVLGGITGIIASPLLPWLVNWFHGRQATASFQAVFNVLGVANPVILSIPALAMPAAANLIARADPGKTLKGLALKYALRFELLLSPWFLTLECWPHNVLARFYGGASVYCNETLPLRIGVLVYLLTVPLTVFVAVLTGAGKAKSNAATQGSGAIASLLCAPPLVIAGGVPGAVLADMIIRGVKLVFSYRLLGQPRISAVCTEEPISKLHPRAEFPVGLTQESTSDL